MKKPHESLERNLPGGFGVSWDTMKLLRKDDRDRTEGGGARIHKCDLFPSMNNALTKHSKHDVLFDTMVAFVTDLYVVLG